MNVNPIQKYVREPQVTRYRFQDDGAIPNNPALPLLFYRAALHIAKADPVYGQNGLLFVQWELSG